MTRPLLLSLCLVLPVACDKSKEAADSSAPVTKKDPQAVPEVDVKGMGGSAEIKAPPADDHGAAAPPAATAELGKPAPDFTLSDVDGKSHSLSQHAGKLVVLEWFNPECPFVKYAHGEGPLVKMAADEMAKGVVWLSINSGAPGKQGHGVEANKAGISGYGMTNPVLLDEDGSVGHMYGAEKTPHVFIVDAEGTLVYRGALDNAPIGEVDGGGERLDYVTTALDELRAGKPVSTPETKPYGCTVKYAKG
ncbi:MAG: thioredoxin family protein [Myxococcales bacterium]|nr:thioredoxin family protein [Myxococcales bacterium]